MTFDLLDARAAIHGKVPQTGVAQMDMRIIFGQNHRRNENLRRISLSFLEHLLASLMNESISRFDLALIEIFTVQDCVNEHSNTHRDADQIKLFSSLRRRHERRK